MVRHVILWVLKDEYSGVEIEEIKKGMKTGLEGLAGKIPGLIDIRVHTEGLSSSNADVMLDSFFEDVQALQNYTVHPAHVEVATTMVRPFVASRVCMDYEE